MKPKELLQLCEKLVKTYDPNINTIDSHVYVELKNVSDPDKTFLQQVFYGCVRYKKVLKVFLSNFYHDNSARTSRNDYTMYMIIAYLSIFRLKELGFETFRLFVKARDPSAMHIFLSYLFDEKLINGAIKSEWIRVLDQQFVEDNMIGGLMSMKTEIDTLLAQLHSIAFGIAAAKESRRNSGGVTAVKSKPVTVPKAPNLTRPRPRHVPEPMKIEQEAKANPVPDLNKLTLSDIERGNQKRREASRTEVLKKYGESDKQPFQLAESKSNIDDLREQIESERNAELKFNNFKAKPAPEFLKDDVEIKMNTAAILREDALYKKKQEKEARLIQAYESDLRDSTGYYRWQSEMLANDQELLKEQIENRRLEMVKAQQEAIEASIRTKQENREKANEMKQISKLNAEQLKLELQEEEQSKRVVAQEIKHAREIAPRLAEDRVREENQNRRKELNEQLAKERERKAQQDLIEQAQREEAIRQIRALDLVHREHVAVFDPTECSNVGLLEEMSLVELKERLELEKIKKKENEEERRCQILTGKKEKENAMQTRIKNITRIRKAAAVSNQNARERRKKAEKERVLKEAEKRKAATLKLAKEIKKKRAIKESDPLAATMVPKIEVKTKTKSRKEISNQSEAIENQSFLKLLKSAEEMAAEKRQKALEASRTFDEMDQFLKKKPMPKIEDKIQNYREERKAASRRVGDLALQSR